MSLWDTFKAAVNLEGDLGDAASLSARLDAPLFGGADDALPVAAAASAGEFGSSRCDTVLCA